MNTTTTTRARRASKTAAPIVEQAGVDNVTAEEVVLTPYEVSRNELSSGMGELFLHGKRATGKIANVAHGMLGLMTNSNGGQVMLSTRGTGDKSRDIWLSKTVALKYASGTLPGKAEDADSDTPTAEWLTDAVAGVSPVVAKAIADAKEAKTLIAKEKNALKRLKLQADYDADNAALGTIKQPIRRALKLLAYVLENEGDGAGDLIPSMSEVRSGTLYVGMRSDDTPADDTTATLGAIAFSDADKAFRKERAPKVATDDATVEATDAVTITPESVRNGGPARDAFADQVVAFTAILSAMDGMPRANEQDAIISLYIAIERKWLGDDSAMARDRLAELRDVIAGE